MRGGRALALEPLFVLLAVGHGGAFEGRGLLRLLLVGDACSTTQVGITQVGIVQVGTAQVGKAQVGTGKVSIAQVGITQVGTTETNDGVSSVYALY